MIGVDLLLTTLSKTFKQVGILVLSVVLTRFLSQTEYGTYLHVQLIANVAIWSFMLGIPHSIYYFLPKVRQQRRLILTTMALVVTIASLVSIGIFVLGDHLQRLLNNPSLEHLIILIAAIAFLQIPFTIFEPTMIAAKKVKVFIAADSVFNIAFFFVIFIPAILTSNLETILSSLAIFYTIQLSVIVIILLKTAYTYDNTAQGSDYSALEQLQYSLPIGLSQGIFELARYGDKVIISHFFDPATLAIYARGAMDIPLVNIINNTIDNLMMPALIESYKEGSAQKLLKLWHDTITLTTTFMYPCFFFLVFSAPYLIIGLYGQEYAGAVPIFQIYSCGILFRVSTYNVIVRVIGKTGMMAWVATVSETANIIGTVVLVKLYGLWGAPFATVLATALIVCGYLIGISMKLHVSVRQIFPWTMIGKIFCVAAIALVPLVPIHMAINNGTLLLSEWPALGLLSLIYTLSYWFLMRFLPILQPYHKELLRTMLPNKLKILV